MKKIYSKRSIETSENTRKLSNALLWFLPHNFPKKAHFPIIFVANNSEKTT